MLPERNCVYESILSFAINFDNLCFIMFTVPLHVVSDSKKQIFVRDRNDCELIAVQKETRLPKFMQLIILMLFSCSKKHHN